MNPNSALTPGAPQINQPDLDDEVVASPELSAQELKEKEIAHLAEHPGWAVFTAKIKKDIADMRSMRTADVSGKSYEAIGQMFLVASLAADKLEAALELVDQTARQVDLNAQAEATNGR